MILLMKLITAIFSVVENPRKQRKTDANPLERQLLNAAKLGVKKSILSTFLNKISAFNS